jgi:hypothetical protein
MAVSQQHRWILEQIFHSDSSLHATKVSPASEQYSGEAYIVPGIVVFVSRVT